MDDPNRFVGRPPLAPRIFTYSSSLIVNSQGVLFQTPSGQSNSYCGFGGVWSIPTRPRAISARI
jgi:hypothetical protein